MKKTFIVSVLILVLSSNTVLAQSEVNYPSEQIKEGSVSTRNETAHDLGWTGLVLLGAAGAAIFYEDHFQPIKEGQNPEVGNHRIIFSAAFNKDAAFKEGLELGGSALEAKKLCDSRKAHFETTYGEGICERVVKYAPGHHLFGELRAATKFWLFIVPTAVVATVLTACTSVCVAKKMKQA